MMKSQEQMEQLRLHGMSSMWQSLQENRQLIKLQFSEGLDLLLQAEKEDRDMRRLKRLHKAARFRYQASMEEISFTEQRNLDKIHFLELSDCRFIQQGRSIIITGATGTGKSF